MYFKINLLLTNTDEECNNVFHLKFESKLDDKS